MYLFAIFIVVIISIIIFIQKSNISNGGAPVISKKKVSKNMTWKQKIKDWKKGINIPVINKNIMFETSPIDFTKENWGVYNEKQIETNALNIDTLEDATPFKDYIKKDKIVAFDNLDKKCRLICPPDDGKNYSHIRNFYLHADKTLIKAIWNNVAREVEKIHKINKIKKIWISTHGLGVSWLHIRICNEPKYYKTKEFIS